MEEHKRLIGDGYEKEKFEDGFRRSAYAFVSKKHPAPDSPSGRALQTMFIDAMRSNIQTTPTRYYQLLEALRDGRDAKEFAQGDVIEKYNGAGEERLVEVMMEITCGTGEKELCIRDEKSAEKYYDSRFPQTEKGKKKLDLSEKIKSTAFKAKPFKRKEEKIKSREEIEKE